METTDSRRDLLADLIQALRSEDDGIDRSWCGEVIDVNRWYDDAPIWKLMRDWGKDEAWTYEPPRYFGRRVWWTPTKPGVYIMQAPEEHGRWRGSSGIYYIGKSENLRRRLCFHEVFEETPDLEVTCKTCRTAREAIGLESLLLRQYRTIHGEYTPRNRRPENRS